MVFRLIIWGLICAYVVTAFLVPPMPDRNAPSFQFNAQDFTPKSIYSLRETGEGWPECDPKVPQWSGFLDVGESKRYFYWGFGPRSGRPDAPIILWMTGGPGCSGGIALFLENGPCLMDETNGQLFNNSYGWNNDAFIFYLDQPAQVGFSTGPVENNEAAVSEDAYWFLRLLFEAHPGLRNNELYIFGESYGGHYAPAAANKIYKKNLQEQVKINLKGLAIGNGLTVPEIQYKYYVQMADEGCIAKTAKTCVASSELAQMNETLLFCIKAIEYCQSQKNEFFCNLAMISCNIGQMMPYIRSGLNVYDVRKPCEHPPMCYSEVHTVKFMNRPDVQKALGVPLTTWQSCNMDVNKVFVVDWFQSFGKDVAELLDSGEVRVMVYAGDADFICNWIGNKAWVMDLKWEGAERLKQAKERAVMDGLARIAMVKSVHNAQFEDHFSFVVINDAGHMVPMDQPASSFYIMNAFVMNKAL